MIGSKIRELRREKMWQQKDLANALQMGVGAISAWETGRAKPSKNAVKEMAKLFNVPIEYLTEDGVGKSKDGSEEATALLKVAENEINQLKDEKEKLMVALEDKKLKLKVYGEKYKELQDENVDLKNEITFLKGEPAAVREDVDGMKMRINELMEENARLKETIVHLAMKGALG